MLERLVRRRLSAVGLAQVESLDPPAVVRRLGAMQSQDYGPATWSIGQRIGADQETVDLEFDAGRILRTHVLRPTWHFVHPDDIRWLLALTRDRVHKTNGFMYRQEGLDESTRDRSEQVLAETLQGGRHLTRTELAAALRTEGIVAERFRLAYLLMSAELNGLICSGARRGREHTYALLEERVPAQPAVSRDEALARLTLRYFASHGPATAKDFGWWSSLTQTEIKHGLELAGSAMAQEEHDGVVFWSGREERLEKPNQTPQVDLLQGYDEYIVGYSQSKGLLDLAGRAKSESASRVRFNGVVLLDGQVAGHWKQSSRAKSAQFDIALYEPLQEREAAALDDAVRNYGRFLALAATASVWVL